MPKQILNEATGKTRREARRINTQFKYVRECTRSLEAIQSRKSRELRAESTDVSAQS